MIWGASDLTSSDPDPPVGLFGAPIATPKPEVFFETVWNQHAA